MSEEPRRGRQEARQTERGKPEESPGGRPETPPGQGGEQPGNRPDVPPGQEDKPDKPDTPDQPEEEPHPEHPIVEPGEETRQAAPPVESLLGLRDFLAVAPQRSRHASTVAAHAALQRWMRLHGHDTNGFYSMPEWLTFHTETMAYTGSLPRR